MTRGRSTITGNTASRDYKTLKNALEIQKENEFLKEKLASAEKAVTDATEQLKWARDKLVEAQNKIRKLEWLLTKSIESL